MRLYDARECGLYAPFGGRESGPGPPGGRDRARSVSSVLQDLPVLGEQVELAGGPRHRRAVGEYHHQVGPEAHRGALLQAGRLGGVLVDGDTGRVVLLAADEAARVVELPGPANDPIAV